MQNAILILFLVCAVVFIWLIHLIRKQYDFSELAELEGLDSGTGLQLEKRQAQFNKAFELVKFLALWLPRLFRRIIEAIGSWGVLYSALRPYFSGSLGGKVPKRLYEGDSAQILLTFPWEKLFHKEETHYGNISYFIRGDDPKYPYLEVELQAAGLKVSGESRQQRPVRLLPAVYTWNISAEKSGNYEVGIVTRLHSDADTPPTVAVSTHKLLVSKLGNLTSRQLWIIAGIFGFFTATLGIVEALVTIKVIDIP